MCVTHNTQIINFKHQLIITGYFIRENLVRHIGKRVVKRSDKNPLDKLNEYTMENSEYLYESQLKSIERMVDDGTRIIKFNLVNC